MAQMSKQAFLVTGAESTGTKLVTQILLAGGCHGDSGNDQWIDRALCDQLAFESDPIVLRLSVPHGLKWPKIDEYLWHLKCLGYETKTLVTVRDWYACGRSQCHNQTHAMNATHSQKKRERAYRSIFRALDMMEAEFCIVTYESLILHYEHAALALIDWCGLPLVSELPTIVDANEKWYFKGD